MRDHLKPTPRSRSFGRISAVDDLATKRCRTGFDAVRSFCFRASCTDAATKAFKPPDNTIPDFLKDLEYDRYCALRFNLEKALWHGEKLPFEERFFLDELSLLTNDDVLKVPADHNGRLSQ